MRFVILKDIEKSRLLLCINKNIVFSNYLIVFLSIVFVGQLYLKKQFFIIMKNLK